MDSIFKIYDDIIIAICDVFITFRSGQCVRATPIARQPLHSATVALNGANHDRDKNAQRSLSVSFM